MSLCLLPWERWLPPYVFGPLLVVISLGVLFYSPHLAWWQWGLIGVGCLGGLWGTWTWFRSGRNVFNQDGARQDRKRSI